MRCGAAAAVAVAIALLGGPRPALAAAPKTLHGAAYEVMKKHMGMYSKAGFYKVVKLGGATTYKNRLAQLRIKVDPNLPPSAIDGRPPVALYDPNTNTLYFSKDPRKAKASEKAALGETVWHEVTHALEDKNGDDFDNDDPLYQDRNTYYMGEVARKALPRLEQLERNAKSGASVAKLKAIWRKYIEAMDDAGELPETTKYPPDIAKMRKWFGFRANPAEIKKLYLSGKVLPGKKGANLRKALAAVKIPQDWAGLWQHGSGFLQLKLTLTVSGDSVTGAWDAPYAGYSDFKGTISDDSETMTGTWKAVDMYGQVETISYDFRIHYDSAHAPHWYFNGTRSDVGGTWGMSRDD